MPFRITIQLPTDASPVVRLEGRLARADLPTLDSCLGEVGTSPVTLDLAQLRGLDAAAAERLASLIRGGASVVAASPYVTRLLAQAPSRSPEPRPSATPPADPNGL